MEQLIQVIIVITFFTLRISMVLRAKIWVEWVQKLQSNGTSGILSLGLINLLLGSIIVTFHWVWEGFAMIVTIIGMIMLCRSFIILLTPNLFLKIIDKTLPKMNVIVSIGGFLFVVIAVLLFYNLELEAGLLTAPQGLYSFVQN